MVAERSTSADLRHELARILNSSVFAQASKQRELLKWLVDGTLAGRANSFDQYAIATDALGYSADFDPNSDSRVRTAVRRLRERLAAYYQNEGRLNRFRITIAEGQYQPQLIAGDSLPTAANIPSSLCPVALSLLVLPFLAVGFRDEGCLCDSLTLNLMRALTASGQARVIPWATAHWLAAKTGDKREHYLMTSANVMLEGLVQQVSEGKWSVSLQWVDGPTGLLDHFYQVHGGPADVLSMIDELAFQVATRLSITYDERVRNQLMVRHTKDLPALTFYYRARRDAMMFTPVGISRAFDFLRRALGRDPYFAAAHSLQAELHLAVGDSGMAPATPQIALAREASEHALTLAPELGDALAARGAIELTFDWNLPLAEATLRLACSDPLAEGAPHWPPILDLAQGKTEEAAIRFESWARLDPACGTKAGVAAELWYYARRFDLAIRWGLAALERDRQNSRAALMVAASQMELGMKEESLSLAREVYRSAPERSEPNLVMAALLAQAGELAEAREVVKSWRDRKAHTYEPPILLAIVYGRLGETSQALEAMQQVVNDRQTVCLFARLAPYLAPLQGEAEFARMLVDAGLPAPPSAEADPERGVA